MFAKLLKFASLTVAFKSARSFSFALILFAFSLAQAQGQTQPQALAQEKPLVLSQEERMALTYLLAGAGKTDQEKLALFERMKAQALRVQAAAPTKIQARTLDEYIKALEGSWPNSFSVESDLQVLEAREARGAIEVTNATPELQDQITKYNEQRKARLEAWLAEYTSAPKQQGLDTATLDTLVSAEAQNKKALEAFAATEKLIHEHYKKIGSINADLLATGQMAGLTPAMKEFVGTILQEYFVRLGDESRKIVIGRLLGGNLQAPTIEKFEKMILAGGPQFQKLMQVIAREGAISPELREVFRKLESKTMPVPKEVAASIIDSEKMKFDIGSFDAKALGTGTMAQVHTGTIANSSGINSVVIRFLKPKIEERVNEDARILKEIAPLLDSKKTLKEAGFPRLEPIVSDLTRTVSEELNLAQTVKQQKEAALYYNKKLKKNNSLGGRRVVLAVPKIFGEDDKSTLMVQEKVSGDKLDKLAEQYKTKIPYLKQEVVLSVANRWLEEVLFGSGFYHADLHQGNFMVDVTDKEVRVNILDFGMSGTISRDLQRQVLTAGAAIDLNKESTITSSFWALSDKSRNQIEFTEFSNRVKERSDAIRSGKLAYQSLADWSVWVMEQGLQFPYEFIGLNRGLTILDKMISETGSKTTTTTLTKWLALRHPSRLISDIRASGEISLKDLAKLGWVSMGFGAAEPATTEVKAEEKSPVKEIAAGPKVTPITKAATRGEACQQIFLKVR